MVQVDEQHGHLGVRTPRPLHGGLQLLHQVVPVGQLRERVMQLQKGFALLGRAARADVVQHSDAVALVMLGHVLAHDFYRHFMSVRVQQGGFVQILVAPRHIGR